jgi:hypothetical protein
MVAHSLHRHSESLVNAFERVTLRVVQEIMKHQYSPTGPTLGSHKVELPFQAKPLLPYALAAPESNGSPAYVVYKVGGDSTHSAPGAQTVEQISAILRDQFGILPKRRAIGYTKPYPSDYDLIPLLPKYRLPEFIKFSGAEVAPSSM